MYKRTRRGIFFLFLLTVALYGPFPAMSRTSPWILIFRSRKVCFGTSSGTMLTAMRALLVRIVSMTAELFESGLGPPRLINGMTAFEVQVTGKSKAAGSTELGPRWRYLASANNQILGSLDGATLMILFDGPSNRQVARQRSIYSLSFQ